MKNYTRGYICPDLSEELPVRQIPTAKKNFAYLVANMSRISVAHSYIIIPIIKHLILKAIPTLIVC